jgi:poly(A) polymerase
MDTLLAGAIDVVRALRDAGHEALFAGGCVRDRLLGRPVHDYDIATSARPDDVERLFSKTVPVGKSFGVIIVLRRGHEYQVATFRSDGPYLDGRHPSSVTFSNAESDVARRDFTINALLFDPLNDRLLDYVGGKKDLDARLIRAVGDPRARFEEDALRLLRAVRFTGQLGFDLDPATEAAVRDLAPTILRTSWERIRDELGKLLTCDRRAEALDRLHRTGLLKVILPEMAATEGVDQPPEFHPEGDVWTHTKLAMKALERPPFIVALATFLHDVGKPRCYTRTDRVRFNGHDKVGAKMAREIGARLKLSNGELDELDWLVDRHLVFLGWPNLRASTLKRLFACPWFDHLLDVIRADALGSMADARFVEEIRAARDAMPPEVIKPEPLVTGHDLIAMGLTPGPEFKRILDAVQDAQLEGRVADRPGALLLARDLARGADP